MPPLEAGVTAQHTRLLYAVQLAEAVAATCMASADYAWPSLDVLGHEHSLGCTQCASILYCWPVMPKAIIQLWRTLHAAQ